MSKRGLTRAAYRHIQACAWEYLLRGGGVIPHGDDLEDKRADYGHVIHQIVDENFGGKRAHAACERACAGLAPHIAATFDDKMWALVTAYIDAAFAFGTAVGLQIHQTPMRPSPRKTRHGDQPTQLLSFATRRTRDDTNCPDDRGDDGRCICRQPPLH